MLYNFIDAAHGLGESWGMKSSCLLAMALFCAVACHAAPPTIAPASPAAAAPATDAQTVNYTVRVEWKDAKKGTNSLQLVTCDGSFSLDTISGSTTLGEMEIPNTVKLHGTLTALDAGQGRLQLFLGRTIPYPTSSNAGPNGKAFNSYSQLSVGLESHFIVTFGKPLVIQADDNGEVFILVKRQDQ